MSDLKRVGLIDLILVFSDNFVFRSSLLSLKSEFNAEKSKRSESEFS